MNWLLAQTNCRCIQTKWCLINVAGDRSHNYVGTGYLIIIRMIKSNSTMYCIYTTNKKKQPTGKQAIGLIVYLLDSSSLDWSLTIGAKHSGRSPASESGRVEQLKIISTGSILMTPRNAFMPSMSSSHFVCTLSQKLRQG